MNFFMVYDIDIHHLNLGKLKIYNFWMKFHSKNVFFLHFFNNECTIISFFKGKTITISNRRRFYK